MSSLLQACICNGQVNQNVVVNSSCMRPFSLERHLDLVYTLSRACFSISCSVVPFWELLRHCIVFWFSLGLFDGNPPIMLKMSHNVTEYLPGGLDKVLAIVHPALYYEKQLEASNMLWSRSFRWAVSKNHFWNRCPLQKHNFNLTDNK